jgi:hypothetical protein
MRCKKILLGFGGSWYRTEEIDFVCKNIMQADSLLVAGFISDLQGVKVHLPCGKSGCQASPACISKKAQRDRARLATYLASAAKENNFQVIQRPEQTTTLDKFLKETRYADLLVISQQTWRATVADDHQTPVSRMLLTAECPVLIVPEQPDDFEQVVLTYDGSFNAMQGIKQFLYLLPELAKNLPITVLSTYSSNSEPSGTEEKLFIEYLRRHFSEVAFHRLNPQTEHTLVRAVGINERTLVIINNRSLEELKVLNSILQPELGQAAPIEIFTPSLIQ